MSLIPAKKVELSELFYDLVFVYAISNMTGLIHHLHHGVVEPVSFFIFIICLIILFNTWMVQTVFTNRYGHNSSKDLIFLLVNMALLLYLSNVFSMHTWQDMFVPFTFCSGLISLTLMLQYLLEYISSSQQKDKQLTLRFTYILAIRSFALLIAPFFSIEIGSVIAIIGILLGWILPSTITSYMAAVPINFPHLAERISLLVIITFGETIIGISSYFTLDHLNLTSLLIFSIVASLFFFYAFEFDRLLNHHVDNETGVKMIYLHYPILIGLSFITVSLGFLNHSESNPIFTISLLYLGLGLFYASSYAHSSYNKKGKNFSRSFLIKQGLMFLLALGGSFYFRESHSYIITLTAGLTLLSTAHLIQNEKHPS